MDPRYNLSIGRLSEENSVLIMSEPVLKVWRSGIECSIVKALRFSTGASYFTSHTR